MKENLKPYVYKQRKFKASSNTPNDLVPFVEWAGELRGVARLSD